MAWSLRSFERPLKPGEERVYDGPEGLLFLPPRLFWAPEGEVPQLVLVHRQRLELTAPSALELEVLRTHKISITTFVTRLVDLGHKKMGIHRAKLFFREGRI